MADAPEVIVDAHLLLDGLQPLGIEFYNVAAILADHVIVMMVSVRMLVDVTPFSRPGDLFHQSALHEKVQCPVYRGPGRFDSPIPESEIEMFGFEVTMEGKDLFKNSGPLFRKLETLFPEKISEDLVLHDQ